MLNQDIFEFHVFDRMTGNSRNDGADAGSGVRTNQITNQNSAKRANGDARGPAHARTQAHEDRCGHNVAHRDVGDHDVFQQRAVDGLKREAKAAVEDAIGNGDVTEAAIRFRAELDAAVAIHFRVRWRIA